MVTRADRRSIPRTIFAPAVSSSMGLVMNEGRALRSVAALSWPNAVRTISVSMNPQYATPAVASVVANSTRSARPSCSTRPCSPRTRR